jgi:hypothetical protein
LAIGALIGVSLPSALLFVIECKVLGHADEPELGLLPGGDGVHALIVSNEGVLAQLLRYVEFSRDTVADSNDKRIYRIIDCLELRPFIHRVNNPDPAEVTAARVFSTGFLPECLPV